MLRRIEDARMLNRGNPHLARRAELLREMVNDHVVRLGRAARPDDVRRMAAEKMRESFTRFPERGAGATPDLMRAGRIARNLLGGLEPGFARLAHHRCGGVMVEINHARQNTVVGRAGEFFVGGDPILLRLPDTVELPVMICGCVVGEGKRVA